MSQRTQIAAKVASTPPTSTSPVTVHEPVPSSTRETYTVDEAAALLGISRGSAYAAAKRGELPTIRFQRRVLVPKGRLHELLGLSPATA